MIPGVLCAYLLNDLMIMTPPLILIFTAGSVLPCLNTRYNPVREGGKNRGRGGWIQAGVCEESRNEKDWVFIASDPSLSRRLFVISSRFLRPFTESSTTFIILALLYILLPFHKNFISNTIYIDQIFSHAKSGGRGGKPVTIIIIMRI